MADSISTGLSLPAERVRQVERLGAIEGQMRLSVESATQKRPSAFSPKLGPSMMYSGFVARTLFGPVYLNQ